MESMEDSTCAHSVVAVMLIGSRFVMVFLRLIFFLDPSHLESILCCNGKFFYKYFRCFVFVLSASKEVAYVQSSMVNN